MPRWPPAFAEPPAQYRAVWSRFDNATGATAPLGETRSLGLSISPPAGLPRALGSFVQIDITADSSEHTSWQQPVRIHFRRIGAGWNLVGLRRLPDTADLVVRAVGIAMSTVPAVSAGGTIVTGADKGWLERLLSPIADVRRGEAVSALLMALTMFLMLGGYYLLKTARESFILNEGGAEVKSYASAGQALMLLLLVPAYGAFASRFNRVQLVQWVTLFFASNLVLFLRGTLRGPACRHRVLLVARHFQRRRHRPVLGVCSRSVLRGAG